VNAIVDDYVFVYIFFLDLWCCYCGGLCFL